MLWFLNSMKYTSVQHWAFSPGMKGLFGHIVFNEFIYLSVLLFVYRFAGFRCKWTFCLSLLPLGDQDFVIKYVTKSNLSWLRPNVWQKKIFLLIRNNLWKIQNHVCKTAESYFMAYQWMIIGFRTGQVSHGLGRHEMGQKGLSMYVPKINWKVFHKLWF